MKKSFSNNRLIEKFEKDIKNLNNLKEGVE